MVVLGASDFYGEQTLEEIIHDIYEYLQKLGVRRFNRFLGRKQAQKCAASWTQINLHLKDFVDDPKNNYTKLMTVLDAEKQRFTATPEYVAKLDKLSKFLKKGPKFAQDYNCAVRMPNGFEKRKIRSVNK
jgi:hypothetical protein